MVLGSAMRAVLRALFAWHAYKGTIVAFQYSYVVDDEAFTEDD